MTMMPDQSKRGQRKILKIMKNLTLLKSDKIILPGEGDMSFAVKQLHKNNLFTMLRVCKKPILGINTGMQVFADHLKEKNINGLGIFPGSIEKFDSEILFCKSPN